MTFRAGVTVMLIGLAFAIFAALALAAQARDNGQFTGDDPAL